MIILNILLGLGYQICEIDNYRWGSTLSCHLNADSFPRYSAIDGLHAAVFPLQMKSVALSRRDNQRLDGMTIFSVWGDKSLIWRNTCSDTFSEGNLIKLVTNPSIVTRQTEDCYLACDRFLLHISFIPYCSYSRPSNSTRFLRMTLNWIWLWGFRSGYLYGVLH